MLLMSLLFEILLKKASFVQLLFFFSFFFGGGGLRWVIGSSFGLLNFNTAATIQQ